TLFLASAILVFFRECAHGVDKLAAFRDPVVAAFIMVLVHCFGEFIQSHLGHGVEAIEGASIRGRLVFDGTRPDGDIEIALLDVNPAHNRLVLRNSGDLDQFCFGSVPPKYADLNFRVSCSGFEPVVLSARRPKDAEDTLRLTVDTTTLKPHVVSSV